ncbi:MAG TPA: hypothetical protein PK453_03595 [Leptospiraceae bacterium]|nr:hypothetical protein [Leptospiraceae bacterium]HMY65029.1 hypothetical protein [Leptospiraceae bacterium]HNF12727.1 hypothetical protein [Leptospiraceae bacterium]HNF22852.1 hypothetical protein [Leptospiraceae bacterium]HNH06852.1 hypothetical protein [Leptospiraceae bacterium]
MEKEIFEAVIGFSRMEEGYVLEYSAAPSSVGKENPIGLSEIKFQRLSEKKDSIVGSYELTEDVYTDWINKNTERSILSVLADHPEIHLMPEDGFNSLQTEYRHSWSMFFTLTRPGVSKDGNTAIVQITGFCPGGIPNYGSILYMENSGGKWNVLSSFGLYNQ